VLETEIMDSGIGIEEDRQELLFKPFSEIKKEQRLGIS
jgi:signal transduction histidine kinase